MANHPYAFISYCHRDNDAVLPILDKLQERRMHIWYDKGIEVGSEWPEYIATSLLNSSCVIAFVSPASIASHNCRREINYAIDKRINMIIAYLEDTELSPGMQLQLNTLQAIFRSNYANDDEFVEALMAASILSPCIEPEPEPEPEPELITASKATPTTAPVKETPKAAAPAEKPPAKKSKAKAAKPASTSAEPKKKSPLPIVIGIVAVIAVVLVAALALGGNSSTPTTKTTSTQSSAPVTAPKTSEPVISTDLAGTWRVVSVTSNGTGKSGISKNTDIGFTLYGMYYGDAFNAASSRTNALSPLDAVTISDDTITFANLGSYLKNGNNFTVTYTMRPLTDEEITAATNMQLSSLRTSAAEFYEGDGNTALVLHITGSYKESSTAIKEVDDEIVLAKYYPVYRTGNFLESILVGSWTDNYGNTWTFGETEDSFNMVNSSGEEFAGEHVVLEINDNNQQTITFDFVDNKESVFYAVIDNVTNDEMHFTKKDGNPLIFTRIES